MLSGKDKSELEAFLRRAKAKRVMIQVPEGLKTKSQELCDEAESLGAEAALCVDPCFGACDLRDHEAKLLGCDALIHLGHAPMGIKTEVPALFLELESGFDPVPAIKKGLKALSGFRKIGLITTIQHIKTLDPAKEFLEKSEKKIFIGKPKGGRAGIPGQVLGCDQSAASAVAEKVDAFLYIGSGEFHPLGVIRRTGKRVFAVSPESDGVAEVKDDFSREKKEIIRRMLFEDASTRNVGIIVSTKKGQADRNAFVIKKKIELMGKKAWILVSETLSGEKLLGLKLDVLVNTACPRMEEDSVWGVPMINAEDLKLIKGFKELKDKEKKA